MEFQQIVTSKIYKLVTDQIKQMVYHKKLRKGDKLPSERELASRLGVSRSAVREALRSLEMMGLLVSSHGRGTFVADSFPQEKLFEPLSLIYALEDNLTELSEVRSILEIQCAGLAAERISPEEKATLKEYIEQLINSQEESKLAEIDKDFHTLIVMASHNKLLYYLYSSIHEVVRSYIGTMHRLIIANPENSKVLLKQHILIYESITTGNAKQARDAMAEHMQFVRTFF
ncbi:MAG: GntR family transcriptional regulator [Firmicutes bacterium]|nr:GntR family transcriptional regulator [Bacillota bacterium]